MKKDYIDCSHEELQTELKKYKEIVDMFSYTVLGGIARMSLNDMTIISATEGYYRMTGYTQEESLLPPFSNCGMNLVLPEDLSSIQAAITALLRDRQPIHANYRIRKKDGAIAWNTAYCPGVDEHELGHYIDVFFLDTTQEKNTELQLASLIDNMASGLIRFKIQSGIHILYANHEFYQQSGYSPEEFAASPIGNDYLRIIHPNDKDQLLTKLQTLTNPDKNRETISFRMIKKDNSKCWMRAYVSRLYEERRGEDTFQCILTDITNEREHEVQNLLNEERFRIISEQTRDVVFDWDITSDSIHYSPVFEKMFGFPPPVSVSTEELLAGDIFYEEDKTIIKQMITDMRAALPYVECRARMKAQDGSYFWTLHRATTIYFEDHNYNHIVGVISDVNDFMRNTLDLQHKATHDQLTGLMNRAASKNRIEQILKERKRTDVYAFIQFDIDRFKQINDFMGHAAGDFALQQIALQMRETFSSDDILIRMGGDEFAIFLVNPGSRESITKKLKQFLHTVSGDFKFEEKIYPLTVSIGTAVCPRDGKTFQELYEHADFAAYQAKHGGGNKYEFFSQPAKAKKSRTGLD